MSSDQIFIEEFRRLEREFIEFKAVQEERYKNLSRSITELRDSIKERDAVTDTQDKAQAEMTMDLNNRVTVIETELSSSRRFVAIVVTIGCGLSATVATIIPMLIK